MGKRLAFITGRARRAVGMHKGKDSPERRQATALVETSREDMARLTIDDGGQMVRRSTDGEVGQTARVGSGYSVDDVPIPLKRVISTGRLSDEEMPSRIIEAVA